MAALPYFSLDVVNFEDVASSTFAEHVAVESGDIFDQFTWGDTSYALITASEAVNALRRYKESVSTSKAEVAADEQESMIDGIDAVIETLEALPAFTMINLGGGSKQDHEKAKDDLFVTTADGKIVVKK
jgi:hypothetical protein